MDIRITLHSSMKDYIPDALQNSIKNPDFTLQIQGKTHYKQVKERLGLPDDLIPLIKINGHYIPPHAHMDYILKEHDHIEFWPPIIGG